MMEKIKKAAGIAGQIMSFITMTFVTILSLATAYIIFAPDEFPKPFYLVYQYQQNSPAFLPSGYEIPAEAQVDPDLVQHTPENQTLTPGEGIMVNMNTKIINLADPGGHKYIRLTVVLEFAPSQPDYKNLPEEEQYAYIGAFTQELTNRMPVMDDVVITLLSTKTFEALYTADGKETLRTEVKDAVNARMPGYQVISVYFTEFVVQ